MKSMMTSCSGRDRFLEVAPHIPRQKPISSSPKSLTAPQSRCASGNVALERTSLACGTGACAIATAVAAALNGLTGREVDVRLRGGTLHIRWDEADGHVFMTGPAAFICDGVFYL